MECVRGENIILVCSPIGIPERVSVTKWIKKLSMAGRQLLFSVRSEALGSSLLNLKLEGTGRLLVREEWPRRRPLISPKRVADR